MKRHKKDIFIILYLSLIYFIAKHIITLIREMLSRITYQINRVYHQYTIALLYIIIYVYRYPIIDQHGSWLHSWHAACCITFSNDMLPLITYIYRCMLYLLHTIVFGSSIRVILLTGQLMFIHWMSFDSLNICLLSGVCLRMDSSVSQGPGFHCLWVVLHIYLIQLI